MPAPTPMLAANARQWPGGTGWVMQPKWDGFRLLVAVDEHREICGYSRHATDLTDRLGELLEPLTALPGATVLDGELVALAERDGRVVQDFAAVGRAALRGDAAAARALHYVTFDLLALDGHDTRRLRWDERDDLLRRVLPDSRRIRAIASEPAVMARHDALVGLDFEGTVLKRVGSTYRPGRQTSWRKVKARHRTEATVTRLGVARDGRRYAVCQLADGPRVTAAVPTGGAQPRDTVEIVYCRQDADGTLREARVVPCGVAAAPATPAPAGSRA